MTAATAMSFEGVFWRPFAALRVAGGQIENRRLAATLLAAITAFSLILAAAPTGSSPTGLGPEMRVAAQTDTSASLVAAGGLETPAAIGGNGSYGYDGSLGCCVAPNTPVPSSPAAQLRSALDEIGGLSGSASSKADLFEEAALAISESSSGAWSATRATGTDGSHIFFGELGEAVVIDPTGTVFRGRLGDGIEMIGSDFRPNYDQLTQWG